MPRGDRTGPAGMGARTGRGAGLCAGNGPGAASAPGRGTGGRGSGMCSWFNLMGFPRWMQWNTSSVPSAEGTEDMKKRLDEWSRRLDAMDKKE